ncbi:MAG: CoA-binding protein [Firmicutes bacterium]|nr:CoA-binding protein [Bacillota bacterium]
MDTIEKNKIEMLKKKRWAVVGATNNESKYGYKIFKKLKENDYLVNPINPKYDFIEDSSCYSSLKELPVKPDVVDVVVPPKLSKDVIEQANKLDIEYLWFQPGTVDAEGIELAEDYGIKMVFHDCVLVALDNN